MKAFIAANISISVLNIIVMIVGVAGGYRWLENVRDRTVVISFVLTDVAIWAGLFLAFRSGGV